jgi:MFS family permease
MRPAELHRSAPVERAKGQIRAGLRYVWHTPELRSTLILTAIVGTFAINFSVVLPVLARITFDGNAETYSWMTIAMGVGALIGSLVVASRTSARGGFVLVAGFGFGAAICIAAAAPTVPFFLVVAVLVGAGQVAFLATCNSLIQLRSDPTMRGRVMSVYSITLLGSTPIGGPIVGWISQVYGARWGLAIGGIATLLAVAYFATEYVRARRGAGNEPEPELELALGPDGEAISAVVVGGNRYTSRVWGTDRNPPERSSAIAGTGSGSPNRDSSL